MLTDLEISDKLIETLNAIYKDGRITNIEFNKIIFYGLYNNMHFQNRGCNSYEELEDVVTNTH